MPAKKKKAARKTIKRPKKKKPVVRKPGGRGKSSALKKKPAGGKSASKRMVLARKPSQKMTPAKKRPLGRNAIGMITHYFPKVQAAVVKLNLPLKVGDTIKIKGHTTDFIQSVTSMQIDRVPISVAGKGKEIGLMVNSRVRRNDVVCQP
ncbi:MAG: hypothetical protein WC469_04110 [Candidatus Omnitrophota bacterium]